MSRGAMDSGYFWWFTLSASWTSTFTFWKFAVLHCRRWVPVGALAAPPVPQWDRYPCQPRWGGRSAQLRCQPARRQTLTTKSGKAFRALRLRAAEAGHGPACIPGAGGSEGQPRGRPGIAQRSHTRWKGWQTQNPRSPHRILPAHTDFFSFKCNRVRPGHSSAGPRRKHGALLLCRPDASQSLFFFYFIYSATQNWVHILLWGK